MAFKQSQLIQITNLIIIKRHQTEIIMAHQKFQDCIQACNACATICSHCATECLKEEHLHHLTKCIQLDLECAAICRSAVELMSLESEFSADLCKICSKICKACAEECEKHAKMGMEHCRECAEACYKCATICEEMALAV
ncbi:four-helix bundle copper-binding protein [Emticicia sp. BO119]|uniref:four-helix bundle copper-binding protein n=1 Tax=Emticicia sp. BO119 TaxID=2757768 RepID=UPI001E5DF96C|nr:four-helix bundle copper-binding protein [Emticicia sp. BO119]